MKLIKAEIISIIVTVLFVAFTAVAALWSGSSDAAVTVSLQSADSAASPSAASPAETASSASIAAASSPSPSTESSPQALINLNTATAEELCALPGIGEKLAQRIIAYRETNGPFKSADEIMDVSGIGSSKYADIKDLITVQE